MFRARYRCLDVPMLTNSFSNQLSVVVVDPRGYTPPYDYSLCNALSQKGCDVLLAGTELGPVEWNVQPQFPVWNRFYDQAKRSPEQRSPYRNILQSVDYLKGMQRFVSMIRKLDPRVIHFQWLPLPLLDQLFLMRLKSRCRLVLTLHNTTLFHGAVSRWRALGFAAALKRFDAIIVHTEFSRQRVLARGWADENKVHVVPHGVLQYYTSVSTMSSVERTTKNLLFFGNLHPYKGVDILLRAFAGLSPTVAANTRLVIAGRPQMDVESLRQLSRDLGVASRVNWMLRPIAESEVPALFRSADAVVLPYREIDQSGVLMTAIAFGKPVLATRVGGIPEIIRDGVHGYLVAPEDIDGLATATDRLLSCEERRLAMEAAVRALCSGSLAWSNIASKTLDLYRKILERRSSATALEPNTRFAHQRAGS